MWSEQVKMGVLAFWMFGIGGTCPVMVIEKALAFGRVFKIDVHHQYPFMGKVSDP